VAEQAAGVRRYYTPHILALAGVRSRRQQLLVALAPAAVNAAGTVVGMAAIDRCGRRRARRPARRNRAPATVPSRASSALHVTYFAKNRKSQDAQAGCGALLVAPCPWSLGPARAPAAPQRARARAQAAAAGQPGGRRRRAGRPGRCVPGGRGRQPAGHRGRHLCCRRRRQLRRLPARGARRAGARRRAPPWPQPLAFHTAAACSRDPRGLRLAARCMRLATASAAGRWPRSRGARRAAGSARPAPAARASPRAARAPRRRTATRAAPRRGSAPCRGPSTRRSTRCRRGPPMLLPPGAGLLGRARPRPPAQRRAARRVWRGRARLRALLRVSSSVERDRLCRSRPLARRRCGLTPRRGRCGAWPTAWR